MAEQPSRRRIVKRVSLIAAGVVLLLATYIAAWGTWHWLAAREVIGGRPRVTEMMWVYNVFAPIDVYVRSRCPGHRSLKIFREWCYDHGNGGDGYTWSQLDEIVPP